MGWWIPQTFLGSCQRTMSCIKAIWLALRTIFMPSSQKPVLIILDTHSVALYCLKSLSSYNVIYIENFYNLKKLDVMCYEPSFDIPSLSLAKFVKCADEIIVENFEIGEIFKKIYPPAIKEPIIFCPSVDLGLFLEPCINIHRIIPDLMNNPIIFLTIGKYCASSNLKLAVDSFEMLIDIFDDRNFTNRFQLVIGAFIKTSEEKCYYNEMITSTIEKRCASQITFLKYMPIIYEKTLMTESTIVIHPGKNDENCKSLLRAMYLGKPIVAANRGIALKFLTHRLSGIIIEGNPRLFAIGIKKLMMRADLQLFLGEMAKETFQKYYSFDIQCDRMRKIIRKYVNEDLRKTPSLLDKSIEKPSNIN